MADPPDDPFPTVPRRRLDAGGWEQTDRREAVRFQLPTLTVREHTLVYEDAALPERTGLDQSLRFFFASRLTFDPPLPPFTGPASMASTVSREARRGFAEELRSRGVADLGTGRRERFRVATGDRARLFPYRGRVQHAATDGLDVAASLAVWTHDRTFYLAGGGYPEQLPGRSGDGDEASTTAFRTELLDLVREVR
jgi:hypothetical protein